MNSSHERSRRPRVPLVLVPFVIYVAVTVLEPAAHGAARLPAFWDHALITFAVSGLLAWGWHHATLAARARTPANPRT